MEIKVWSPIVCLLICFKKASKLKKYTAQMKFIYKSNPSKKFTRASLLSCKLGKKKRKA